MQGIFAESPHVIPDAHNGTPDVVRVRSATTRGPLSA